MQFALLVYHDENRARTPDEACAHRESMEAVVAAARDAGVLLSVARLQHTPSARTGRARSGAISFTDGPFAETKEQLGGLCILDCRDEAEAREWAARFLRTGCPGAVEVRPLLYVPATEPSGTRELAAV